MLTTTSVGALAPASARLLDADSDDPFVLNIATPAQTPLIDALRQKAYMAAGYFSLPDPRTVRRATDPAHAICLVIASKRELAATVRLAWARDRKQAESILEGSAELGASYFPSLVMCRGATDPAFRGLGLMAFFASMGPAIAQRAGLGSALGVQYEGTPHFRAMSAAGWERKPIGGERMATVKGNAALSLVYIGRERFAASVRHSERVHAELHRRLDVPRVVADAAALIAKLR
jgi:hypothetical protein